MFFLCNIDVFSVNEMQISIARINKIKKYKKRCYSAIERIFSHMQLLRNLRFDEMNATELRG